MKLLNGFSLASAALGALSLSFGLSLVACGSDSSSSNDDNKGSNGIAEYETLDEMVHCTKSHYGEVAHVAETDSIYECTSEGWVVADSAKVEEILSSSDSKSDSDGKSSGSKSDSGDSDEKSSSSITASAEDTAKVETVKVDSVTVLGLAEKGPFTKGTVVNVYGLDSALNKSKTSFKGAVNDDKGNYSVSKIKLSSQYAMVEVNGFFNNEVTGKVTSGTKTKLRALVDLSEGDTVKANVNVLTDLEYERAIALVKNDKYNVPAAKARATKEILAAFGVSVDSVTATKLSLTGEGAATNGLLAASVAVIGNLSLSKFQARLGDVAESLAATGSISDTLRAEIADDLSLLDSNGAMVDIMKNIKALNAKATGVDSLLYAFWSDNYKLPACDAKAEETIAKNGNKLSSNYGAGYACTSNRWHKSTALDTELGLCVAKNEGKYETTKGGKYYTCKAGQWREITKEQYTLGACTEEIAKDAAKKYKSVDNKKYFVCKDLQWEEITADEYELKDCGADKNETVVAAKTSKVSYVCLDGAWRKATAQEEAFGYCSKVDSTKFETLEKVSYACLEEGWTKVDDLTAELGFCTGMIPESKMFETKSGEFYSCVDDQWISVDKVTAVIGKYCESENDGDVDKVSDGDLAGSYLCIADKDWTLCGEDNDNEYKVDYDKVCQDMVWREAKPGEKAAGAVCDETKNEKVVKGVDSYFTCLDGEWVAATERDYEVGKPCIKSNKDDIVLDGKYMCRDDNETPEWTACDSEEGEVKGSVVCENGTWRHADAGESSTGMLCNVLRHYVVNGDYACDLNDGEYAWRPATDLEKVGGSICYAGVASVEYKDWKTVGSTTAICYALDGIYAWRKASEGDLASQKLCYKDASSILYDVSYFDGKGLTYYACDVDGWHRASDAEVARKRVCNKNIENQFAWVENSGKYKPYRCQEENGQYAFREYNYKYVTHGSEYYKYVDVTYGSKTQLWLAENLRHITTGAGTSVCPVDANGNGDSKACSKYGRFYLYDVVADNPCPTGWRVTNSDDWTFLQNASKSASSGYATMEAALSVEEFDWGKGTDRLGLSILPAGYVSYSSYRDEFSWYYGDFAYFWTDGSPYPYRGIYYSSSKSGFTIGSYSGSSEYRSIRCVKD